MNRQTLLDLLERVRSLNISPEQAAEKLRNLPFEDAEFAKIDHHRTLRTGLPEVIYSAGKTPAQVSEIFLRMTQMGTSVLATRANEVVFAQVKALVPEAHYYEQAKIVAYRGGERTSNGGPLAVLSAGTSDQPAAEEAAVAAECLGAEVERVFDVGVAGLHRLLAHRDVLDRARVVIVCAGMEGALPSVVGGLVGAPVIAVPTSVGYGTSFGGLTALLGMLNSCSPNVTTVNIDNGFGAAYVACSMLRQIQLGKSK
ncbi:MAG: nickel pincer cofactor biosynthesis protein LarB [Acidobacteriaceae bacterium]